MSGKIEIVMKLMFRKEWVVMYYLNISLLKLSCINVIDLQNFRELVEI